MRSNILFILLLVISVCSCVDTINLDLPEKDKRLVIEGLLTNQDTSYTVKLSKTSKYTSTYYASSTPEYGATIIISDNQGNMDTLKQTSIGIYQTDPVHMRGVIGRSYKIDIFTQDGKHYTSTPEEMLAVPKIDSIYFERDYNDVKSGYTSYKNTIYLDWWDPGNVSNYYLHHFSYFWDQKWHDESQWNTIFNDNLFNGQHIKKYVASKEYDGKNFKVRISRYSLSKNAYEFWNLLFQQLYPQDDGIVSTSVPLIGNLYNVKDQNDYVLGYFQISALDVKEIFIDR